MNMLLAAMCSTMEAVIAPAILIANLWHGLKKDIHRCVPFLTEPGYEDLSTCIQGKRDHVPSSSSEFLASD